MVPAEDAPIRLGWPDLGEQELNLLAFNIVTGFTQGNLGRNVLRGFGEEQLDLSLRRAFPITERLNLTLSAQAFNVFNHPNFANFGGMIVSPQGSGGLMATSSLATALSGSGTLGQLNQLFQIGGPRSLQLALRLNF